MFAEERTLDAFAHTGYQNGFEGLPLLWMAFALPLARVRVTSQKRSHGGGSSLVALRADRHSCYFAHCFISTPPPSPRIFTS
jgi:hypothetical protein